MRRIPAWAAGTIVLASLLFGTTALADPFLQEHARMLIDKIPADMWPRQRPVRPDDYPIEQRSLQADVAAFLKGHFRITGDRLFVIPPDKGILLSGGMFELGGPGQFQEVQSEPAFDRRPFIRLVPSANGSTPDGSTLLTIGMTQSQPRIYTAIALHYIPNSPDELIGYFQLEPFVSNPA